MSTFLMATENNSDVFNFCGKLQSIKLKAFYFETLYWRFSNTIFEEIQA